MYRQNQPLTIIIEANRPLTRGDIPAHTKYLIIFTNIYMSWGEEMEYYMIEQCPEIKNQKSSVLTVVQGPDYLSGLGLGLIPEGVTDLIIICDDKLKQPLVPGIIPNSVKNLHLIVEDCRLYQLKQPLVPGIIPDSVIRLNLDCEYQLKQPLVPGIIPNSVIDLTLYYCRDQPLIPGAIPEGVKQLVFFEDSKISLTFMNIPCTLQYCNVLTTEKLFELTQERKKYKIATRRIVRWWRKMQCDPQYAYARKCIEKETGMKMLTIC